MLLYGNLLRNWCHRHAGCLRERRLCQRGEDRETQIFFQDESGGQGDEYLRLQVDANSLLAAPDGSPILPGDSVLIQVCVVDP